MAQCVAINALGQVVASSADPCNTFVILTPVEFSLMSSIPWNLSLEDGAVISAAIVGIWAAAFAWRAAIRALGSDDAKES